MENVSGQTVGFVGGDNGLISRNHSLRNFFLFFFFRKDYQFTVKNENITVVHTQTHPHKEMKTMASNRNPPFLAHAIFL